MTRARSFYLTVLPPLVLVVGCARPREAPPVSEVSVGSSSAPRRLGGGPMSSSSAGAEAGVRPRTTPAPPADLTADAIVSQAVRFGPPEDRRQELLAWYRQVDDRPWYVDRALVLVQLLRPDVPEKTWALIIAVRTPTVPPPSKQSTDWRTPRHYHGEPFGVEWYPACPTAAEVDAFLKARTIDFTFEAPSGGFRFIDNGVEADTWRARFGTEMPYAFAR